MTPEFSHMLKSAGILLVVATVLVILSGGLDDAARILFS